MTEPAELSSVDDIGQNTGSLFERILSGVRRQPVKKSQAAQSKERLLEIRTERLRESLREKEREVERLRGALEALEEGMLLVNADGEVMMMNTAARDLVGGEDEYRLGELSRTVRAMQSNQSVGEVVPNDAPQRVQFHDRVLALRLASVSSAQGRSLGTLVVIRDVSSEQVSKRLRTHFVTAISHELRTPMQSIKGAADLLEAQLMNDPQAVQMVELLTHNVDVLDRMVVEMLDLAEMGAGTFKLMKGPVELEALLSSVVRSMMPEVQRGKLEIKLMLRDVARLNLVADETRLRWAIGHLLRNGIQYTEPEGCIWVAAGIDDLDSYAVAIDVVDTGVGIADEDLPHVFERFYRGSAVSESGRKIDPRGLGQGLFIAREVAAAHGGGLTAHSSVGKGSSFTLTLPLD
ncbi:MAG: PAS domain-containing protein [Chloroflexi bacterium]|nr:PAS domain-containing protein [Chloroflexota bacterium]